MQGLAVGVWIEDGRKAVNQGVGIATRGAVMKSIGIAGLTTVFADYGSEGGSFESHGEW